MINLFVLRTQIAGYGVSKGMINSNQFIANRLNSLGIPTKVVTVKDDNGIDREIKRYNPDNVFIEALWARPVKVSELAQKYPNKRFSIRCHSKAPFLASESGIVVEWLNDYVQISRVLPNVRVSSNNDDFTMDLRRVFLTDAVDYLPNIYWPLGFEYSWYRNPKPETGDIHIGCFGAIRPMKNHFQQAVASMIFADEIGKNLNFCINANRVESHGEHALKNIRALFKNHPRHSLIEFPWMDHDEFVKILYFMDISLSISLSESFNIVHADSIANNVVSIASTDVKWAPSIYKAIPTDTEDMVNKMWLGYKLPRTNNVLNTLALKRYNNKSTKIWLDYING